MAFQLFTAFCVLAVVTGALALRRLAIVRVKGDECLHLMDAEAPQIEKQRTSARRLEAIDCWGKGMTILTVLTGIASYCVWWVKG